LRFGWIKRRRRLRSSTFSAA